MRLNAGDKLGPYEILASLGAGGMGEVYKARDAKLDRMVALKLLPPDKIASPDRKRRFLQEARSASALNHPNIVTVHDIASDGGIDYIVMEHVAGRTLDEMITPRGMPLAAALRTAVQIADALAAAHESRIVHRDLKPGNIMLTEKGHVKVLDFGLAKLSEPVSSDQDDMTRTVSPATEEGTILGTVSYMSPEQAEGKKVDARSDIFSFGAVLYEMVTGRRAFAGDSKLSTLAGVLNSEPAPLGGDVPIDLAKIIQRCLRKDPARRFQNMADLKVALEELREDADSGRLTAQVPAAAKARFFRHWPWVAAAMIAVLAGVLYRQVRAPAGSGAAAPQEIVPLTSFSGSESTASFSPEGDRVVFSWNGPDESNYDIYVKLIGTETIQRLTNGPEPEFGPSWSPDGRQIAFARSTGSGKIQTVLIPSIGGPERVLAESTMTRNIYSAYSAAWSRDGKWIIFSAVENPRQPAALFALSVETGARQQLTSFVASGFGDLSPALSPDGRTLAFTRYATEMSGSLFLLKLNQMTPVGEPVPFATEVEYAMQPEWMPGGEFLLFATSAMETSSRLYLAPAAGGAAVPLAVAGTGASRPAISRDGKRLAFQRGVRDANIWLVEGLRTGKPKLAPFRAINSTYLDHFPQYSPDGSRIAFESARSGAREIWVSNLDGTDARQLSSHKGPHTGGPRWSPDGRFICYHSEPGGNRDLYVVSPAGGPVRQLTTGPSRDGAQSYSRDGRFLYFSSDRSGSQQIWKMPSQGGDAVQVTRQGGAWAFESEDGKFLYYAKNDPGLTSIWRTPVEGGDELQIIERVLNAGSFVTEKRGIYYVSYDYSVRPRRRYELQFYDFAREKSSTIVEFTSVPQWGISLSPDGDTLLYSQTESSGTDLMLIDNFRQP